MARLLVTGGAGFIGSHIVEAALSDGHQVRVLDNLSTGNIENLRAVRSQIELIVGDVVEPEDVARAMDGVEWVSHQAAAISVPGSFIDPVGYDRTNVLGTLNVLDAAARASVHRLVIASSSAVYGETDVLPISEDTPTAPQSPYAATKLCAEVYCQTYALARGMQTTALRYFNVFGPRQDPRSEYAAVIPKFVERLRGGRPPIIFGSGEQTRDFVYVGDVARANLLALSRTEGGFRVFNVAAGRRFSLLELAAELNAILGTRLLPTHLAPRKGDIKHSGAAIERAAREIGFEPAIQWREALSATVGARVRSMTRSGRSTSDAPRLCSS